MQPAGGGNGSEQLFAMSIEGPEVSKTLAELSTQGRVYSNPSDADAVRSSLGAVF